jgi:penicillin-binding protein 1A
MILRVLHFIYRFIVLVVTVVVGVPVTMVAVILAGLLFLPLPAALPAPRAAFTSLVSTVYDDQGNQIGTFREFDQAIPVAQKDIPTALKQAVVSVEDRNFYKHGGVDLRGTFRALYADLTKGKAVQGGSTITQQYVKNAYTGNQRTIIRKVREAILASQLDRQTPKDDILYHYLDSIYLGDGSYGVGAAAANYFHKSVKDLDISESATLAGLIPAPSLWAPRENPSMAEARRELVLQKMLEQGYISQATYDRLKPRKIWLLAKGPPPPGANVTLVFPPVQDKPLYPDFVDYVQRYLILKYGPEMVYRGGLKVYTTLDPAKQQAALDAVHYSLSGDNTPDLQNVQMGLASVDPSTGYVEALVGGRSFGQGRYADDNFGLGGCYQPPPGKYTIDVAASCWQGDTVTGGGTGRQPGSAFKPFVLATALTKGFSPSRTYSAPNPYVIPGCKPVSRASNCDIFNAEPGSGIYDIRRATWYSVNTVYAQLVRDVGCKDTAETAKKLGITSAWYSPNFHTCSGTYALGVVDVSPLDMASAYGVFANHGIRVAPTPVVKVLDAKGKVLEDNTHRVGTRVLDAPVADTVTDILRGVIQYGTGTGANIGRPAAGKTGTASDFTNAWFSGYTPALSTAVWMGYANNQSTRLVGIPFGRGRVGEVFGGTIPATTWKNYMQVALKDVPPTDFSQPAPLSGTVDQAKRQQRQGFDLPYQQPPDQTGAGGPYQYQPPPAVADLPTTTTTSTTSTTAPGPTSSTSTTAPGGLPPP